MGDSIAHKIKEYLQTGKIEYYEEFKRKLPIALNQIVSVAGVGPKKAKVLYDKLGIKTLEELEEFAKSHQIAPLFGFGDKTEKNILQGIEFLKGSKGRFLLGEILPIADGVMKQLQSLPAVERVDAGGSLRRQKETIGDLDFLVISDSPEKVMDFFGVPPRCGQGLGPGGHQSPVRLRDGLDMDLRVIPRESYGAALQQFFTGSKDHNIALRKIAIDHGFKLSEYGLFQGSRIIAAVSEAEVYGKLDMPFIPPELRGKPWGNRGRPGRPPPRAHRLRRLAGRPARPLRLGRRRLLHRQARRGRPGHGLRNISAFPTTPSS